MKITLILVAQLYNFTALILVSCVMLLFDRDHANLKYVSTSYFAFRLSKQQTRWIIKRGQKSDASCIFSYLVKLDAQEVIVY